MSDDQRKDPWRVALGKTGMRARWGPQRILRLDQLDPVTAQIVRAILAARDHAAEADEFTPDERALADAVVRASRKNAKKATPAIVTPEAALEARRARDEHPTAARSTPAPAPAGARP